MGANEIESTTQGECFNFRERRLRDGSSRLTNTAVVHKKDYWDSVVGGGLNLHTLQYETETSEILVSREFSRFFFHFHFSFSISNCFNFTFTSRKRVKGFYFSLFTSKKKWKLSVFHSFFSRKKGEIRSGV